MRPIAARQPALCSTKPHIFDSTTRPLAIPPGHVGPMSLPGTGRMIWWTGRVAIGLRHEASRSASQAVSSSALWLQSLLLGSRRPSPSSASTAAPA